MEQTQNMKIEQLEAQFIEKIAENMPIYGVSTTVGRVLGIMYTNKKPMTLDELSVATSMSKTRMSQVVREMLDLNIAEKVFEKGVRKDLYNVDQDYYETFISLFTFNWQKPIKKNKVFEKKLSAELLDMLEEGTLTEEAEDKVNQLLKETKDWIDFYQWLSQLIEFFDSGEIFKHVPKP